MRRILILEDVAETRRWLARVALAAFPDAEIFEAESLRVGRAAAESRPDLALIDLRLPDGSGLDLLGLLRANSPDTTCVITTVMGDDADVVAALSQGAQGYLLKDQDDAMLTHLLRQLSLGIPALSPVIARRIMNHFRDTGPVTADVQLTRRETDVLTLIARGLRNAEVATELGLAETTVTGYIKDIYRKLGISSRAEASWHATRLGLRTSAETDNR
ncbi:LuxR C-terminal-related transcriptional regulator [Oricola sp.]|uniref:LuxR C-terminal-related transcriptional regulator n=1 Tax=Oricola sp. TaxID=1979950 RepID=UPI003BAB5247